MYVEGAGSGCDDLEQPAMLFTACELRMVSSILTHIYPVTSVLPLGAYKSL